MSSPLQKQLDTQRGLSLVELLIAMALSLILMTGVISIFISAKQGYSTQDASAQVQENARFALDMLTHQIRMAGYGGCPGDVAVANSIDGDVGFLNTFSEGLRGYEGDATNSTFPTQLSAAAANTDAIIVHTADSDSALFVKKHKPNSATIKFNTAHSFQVGDVMMIADANCSSIGIFAYSGPANVTKNATQAVHNTGTLSGFSYSNCTKRLKGSFDCDDTSGAIKSAFSAGSTVLSLESYAFYIAESSADASINSLYRLDSADNAEELVEGISDLEIFYGLYDNDTLQYVKPASVGTNDWTLVRSVRVNFTSSSLTNIEGAPLTRTFSTTINLRNRGEES